MPGAVAVPGLVIPEDVVADVNVLSALPGKHQYDSHDVKDPIGCCRKGLALFAGEFSGNIQVED